MESNLMRGVLIAACGIFLAAGYAFGKSPENRVTYKTKVGKNCSCNPVTTRSMWQALRVLPRSNSTIGTGTMWARLRQKIVSQTNKNNRTEVDYSTVASNHAVLTEISPKGWFESLVFSHKNGGASGK